MEDEEIRISRGDFQHLLNCLANQKFIREQTPENQEWWQMIIDKAWTDGMDILYAKRKE